LVSRGVKHGLVREELNSGLVWFPEEPNRFGLVSRGTKPRFYFKKNGKGFTFKRSQTRLVSRGIKEEPNPVSRGLEPVWFQEELNPV